MFPLCEICAEKRQETPYERLEEERCITGTWVTEEVKLAIEKGYRVTKVCKLLQHIMLFYIFSF